VQYVLELYLPRLGAGALPNAAERACSASEQLRREGKPMRFLRSIFLPGDEICFLVFEGPSEETVAEAARRAEIVFERVVPAEVAPDESALAPVTRPWRLRQTEPKRDGGG
jgi:Nickel responsive protein SCO4226-like